MNLQLIYKKSVKAGYGALYEQTFGPCGSAVAPIGKSKKLLILSDSGVKLKSAVQKEE